MPESLPRHELSLRLLSGMARLLQSCPDEDALMDVIYWFLPPLFPGAAGELFLGRDADREFTRALAWEGADGPPPPAECPALAERMPTAPELTEEHAICADCTPGASCMPLVSGRRSIGVLRFAEPGGLDSEGMGLRFIAAEHVALAMANIRLRRQLLDMAMRDPLTGLHNRRHMKQALAGAMERANQSNSSVGLIIFDLDHFKSVNDTFGHDAGDAALSIVGELLRTRLRAEDVACRYGGEEFLVILEGGSYEDAIHRAEDLRRAVKAARVVHEGTDIGSLSVSAGVAAYPLHAQSADALVHAADQALLRAKTGGRDTVFGQEDTD